MCRWRSLVLAAGFCGLVAWEASAQTLTETQALTRMRMEHPLIHVLRFRVNELAADARERSLLANPTVSYTREDAGLSVDDFVLVTQELPLRGRRGLLEEGSGQALATAEARADADLLAFETRLRLAFTDLLLAQARTEALETGVSELTRLVDVLRAREEQGEGSRFDRLRAEREVAEIGTDLDTVTVDRGTAQARIAAFFAPGTDPAGLRAAGRLAADGAVPDIASLLTQALADRPDYRALTFGEARWDTERRAAERLRFPATSVTAGWKRAGPPGARDSGYALTATLGVPLFSRGQAQVDRGRGRAREGERRTVGARLAHRKRGPRSACRGFTVSRAGGQLSGGLRRTGGRAGGDCHGGLRRR